MSKRFKALCQSTRSCYGLAGPVTQYSTKAIQLLAYI